MTFLEKALEIEKEKGSGMNIFQIMQNSCPSDYGFKNIECIKNGTAVVCMSCWNREMPSEYPYNVQTDKRSVDLITEVSEQTQEHYYNKGLKDAWEFLDRIEHAIKSSVLIEVFGYSNIGDILDHFKPQEAIAKLKAYEEAKIEVGDVVFCLLVAEDDNDTEKKDNYGVVTGIYRDHYEILMKNGDTTGFKKETCKKTGKHIDIQSILEQIGE